MQHDQKPSLQPADDWDEHWTNLTQSASENPAQKYRFRLILEELAKVEHHRPLRIADVGCGQGDLLFAVQHRFPAFSLMGIDLSQEAVNTVKAKTGLANVFQTNLLDYAGEYQEFHGWADVVICSEVLEHVDVPAVLLNNAILFLKPEGMLIMTVPGGPISGFDRSIGHRQHFNDASIAQLLTGSGIEKFRIYRSGFPWHNLYRLVVIGRGDKLTEDASGTLDWSTLAAMRLFSVVFRLNLKTSPWGWQNLVVAWKA